jgi:tetratricopeptide (TPR) repeat protein
LKIELSLSRARWTQHNLGRFRLSVSGDPAIFAHERYRFAAMAITPPWARLAAAYWVTGDQQALDRLRKNHPAAVTTGIGDLYTSAEDWERAIAEYLKVLADHPADAALAAKLATVYQAAGRTREALPLLATASSANPNDTFYALKVAALQAWFGQDKEFAATRHRVLASNGDTNLWYVVHWATESCSILPSNDKKEREAVLALARKVVKAEKNEWTLLSLGMAEYRSGNDAAAEEALRAAGEAKKNNPHVAGTSAFFRAMSLFRQGKRDEARKLVTEAAATMKPLPKDEQNPLAGKATPDDLILWLTYKEAKAMVQLDVTPPAKVENHKK